MKDKIINPIDVLLDPNNYDNVVLYNDKDEPVEFEQIAIIPLDDKTYVILQPVNREDIGIEEDEAFAFEIIQDEEKGDSLVLVEDDVLRHVRSLFEIYENAEKELIELNIESKSKDETDDKYEVDALFTMYEDFYEKDKAKIIYRLSKIKELFDLFNSRLFVSKYPISQKRYENLSKYEIGNKKNNQWDYKSVLSTLNECLQYLLK